MKIRNRGFASMSFDEDDIAAILMNEPNLAPIGELHSGPTNKCGSKSKVNISGAVLKRINKNFGLWQGATCSYGLSILDVIYSNRNMLLGDEELALLLLLDYLHMNPGAFSYFVNTKEL